MWPGPGHSASYESVGIDSNSRRARVRTESREYPSDIPTSDRGFEGTVRRLLHVEKQSSHLPSTSGPVINMLKKSK